jgi:hypothetical protein
MEIVDARLSLSWQKTSAHLKPGYHENDCSFRALNSRSKWSVLYEGEENIFQ